MARLDDMQVFAALAEAGSITAAARLLGMTKQTVSRRLAELEDGLGVELARRTTRSLTLTDIGRAYAERCREITRLADEANRAVASHVDEVGGVLRITADHTFGEAWLPGLIAAFLRMHPAVEVEVLLTARKVDLHEERVDVAFRIGAPPDVTTLAATRLGPAALWTVAAPAYLTRQGAPTQLVELADHECISVVPTLRQRGWPMRDGDRLRIVPVAARLTVNGMALGRRAALSGVGIAHLPAFAVAEDVDQGRLVRLLDAHSPEVGGIHVIYPHVRLLAPKVSEFVALAVERFGSGV